MLDRLVEGPASQFDWQKEALQHLLLAARNLIASRPACEQGKSWVALLTCHPGLWSSEVTVFFDPDYLRAFVPAESTRVNFSLAELYDLPLGDIFSEYTYDVSWDDEDENFQIVTVTERRITMCEKSFIEQGTQDLGYPDQLDC